MEMSQQEIKQKDYYNKIAVQYDEHYAHPSALVYRWGIYDQLLKHENFEGKEVLDALCGGGQSTGYFLKKGANVTGLDISEKQCENFKNRFPSTNVRCESAIETSFADNTFDFIVTDSLHHTHPHFDRCIQEFHRILKPGGRLMAWEPAAGSFLDRIRNFWYSKDPKFFEENEAAIDLKKLMADHGNLFNLKKSIYGGNVGYLFVLLSMPMRIPSKWVPYYANFAIKMEKVVQNIQSQITSMWVLFLLEKK